MAALAGFGRRRALWLLAWLAAVLFTSPALAETPFAHWAAVIVSGDDRSAHVDAPTETFDNARRDVARALVARGFTPANIAQFSVEPDQHPDTRPGLATLPAIAVGLRRLAAQAPDGCLVYLTSHGSPDGAVLGDWLIPPRSLARLIGGACGGRPTVAVISACFSGVFVPALKGPNRLVLTAARRDRSSFGCGESDRYPFFDGCILESLPASADFMALATRTRACVARREREEGMSPPSEPQTAIGARFHSPRFGSTG
jgi:hypothetical protein